MEKDGPEWAGWGGGGARAALVLQKRFEMSFWQVQVLVPPPPHLCLRFYN